MSMKTSQILKFEDSSKQKPTYLEIETLFFLKLIKN